MTDLATPAPARTDERGTSIIRGRHLPALDGLRALAVLGVMAYHLGLGSVAGGYLGVDLFFVLSGFLITTLLIEERLSTGVLALRAFWGRRARRLLPASLSMVVVVVVTFCWAQRYWLPPLQPSTSISGLRGDAYATVLYVANWHAIFAKESYFALFQAPSPLKHTWSLAIEEQFYLVWPLVVAVIVKGLRGSWRRVGAIVGVGTTVASALVMLAMFEAGVGASAIYYNTFARAFDLTVGASLAFLLAGKGEPSERGRRTLALAAPVSLVLLLGFWHAAGKGGIDGLPKRFMFQGGFLVCAVLAAVVIADARQQRPSVLGRVLGWAPLAWIGTISYGLYLWHWPAYCLLTPLRTNLSGHRLDLVKVAVTFVLATVSFYLLERPLRRMRYPKLARWTVAPIAMAATIAITSVATAWAVPPLAATPPTAPVTPVNGVIPGSGGLEGQVPIHLRFTPSPRHKVRVLILGDSVMFSLELALAKALGSTGEAVDFKRAFPGWGLTKDPNWSTVLAGQLQRLRPTLVVAMWGWDNRAALEHPALYDLLLDRFVHEATSGPYGAKGFLFLEYPPTGDLGWAGSSALGEVLGSAPARAAFATSAKSVVARHPGVAMYLPVASSLLLNGAYTSWLPPSDHRDVPKAAWVRVRSVDTVHICQPGAVEMAAAVAADFEQVFSMAPPMGPWWTGRWVHDPRYAGQLIDCPDDHPRPGKV